MSPHTETRAKEYERLINKPIPRKIRRFRKPKPRAQKRIRKSWNNLIFRTHFLGVRRNPTSDQSMAMLRNTILPVTQDWDKVVRWLNTVTIK